MPRLTDNQLKAAAKAILTDVDRNTLTFTTRLGRFVSFELQENGYE